MSQSVFDIIIDLTVRVAVRRVTGNTHQPLDVYKSWIFSAVQPSLFENRPG